MALLTRIAAGTAVAAAAFVATRPAVRAVPPPGIPLVSAPIEASGRANPAPDASASPGGVTAVPGRRPAASASVPVTAVSETAAPEGALPETALPETAVDEGTVDEGTVAEANGPGVAGVPVVPSSGPAAVRPGGAEAGTPNEAPRRSPGRWR